MARMTGNRGRNLAAPRRSPRPLRVKAPAGGSAEVRLRLTALDPAGRHPETGFGAAFDRVMADREREADAFYASITPPSVTPERASIMRQALAGMIWSKQYYGLDVERWLQDGLVDFVCPMTYNDNLAGFASATSAPIIATNLTANGVTTVTLSGATDAPPEPTGLPTSWWPTRRPWP